MNIYEAIDCKGKKIIGLSKLSYDDLKAKLLENNYYIIEIKEWNYLSSRKLDNSSLVFIFENLYLLLSSGMDLVEAMTIIHGISPKKDISEAVDEIKSSLERGASLAQALEENKYSYPKLLILNIRSADLTGNIEEVSKNIFQYYKQKEDLRNRVKKELSYPVLLLTLSILLIIFILIYFIPIFIDIYSDYNFQLSRITSLVFFLSKNLQEHYASILMILIISLASFLFIVRFIGGINKYKLPVLGGFFREIMTIEIINILALLSSSGLTVYNSLLSIENLSTDKQLKKFLSCLNSKLERGRLLSDTMKESDINNVVISFISIGEQTGDIPLAIQRSRNYLNKSFTGSLDKIVEFVEPCLLIFVGIILTVILISIVSPMISLLDSII